MVPQSGDAFCGVISTLPWQRDFFHHAGMNFPPITHIIVFFYAILALTGLFDCKGLQSMVKHSPIYRNTRTLPFLSHFCIYRRTLSHHNASSKPLVPRAVCRYRDSSCAIWIETSNTANCFPRTRDQEPACIWGLVYLCPRNTRPLELQLHF